MLLCVGQSAWADELNATVKMTYVDYDNADTSYGEITAGSTAISGYNNISNGSVGFGNTSWNKNYITYLQVDASALPSGATIISAVLSFEQSGSTDSKRETTVGAGYNSSSWSNAMTYNTADKTITTVGSTVSTTTKSAATFESKEITITDALNNDDDNIVTILLYETAAAGCYIKNPAVTVVYSTETVYTATFNESNSLSPTVTIYSDSERTAEVTNGTLTNGNTYYYTATLAGYNDYQGSFTVASANPSVEFTMTAKTRHTFTINLIDASSNIIVAYYVDTNSYEGKTHTVTFSKYLTDNDNKVTYSKDNDTYYKSYTALDEDETYTQSYTAYSGTAYFVEVESVVSGTTYTSGNCSNNSAVRGFTTSKDILTVPVKGKYNVTYTICNNNVNYSLTCTLSKSSTEIATSSDLKSVSINYLKTTGVITNEGVILNKDDILQLTPSSTNGILDYMLIVQTDVDVRNAIATCEVYETSEAFATYIEDLYDEGSLTTAAEVYAAHTAWQVSQAASASSNDITKVILDAGVSNTTQYWNGARVSTNQQYSGAPDNTYFDAWDSNVSNASQTIYGLPAGTYTLKVATRASAALEDIDKYNVWANGGTANVRALGNHIGNSGGCLTNGWSWTTMTFTLDAKADVTIGFYSLPGSGTGLWSSCDDWHLYTGTLSESVTVTSAGLATYVSAYDLDFSASTIKAYKVKVASQGVATLTQVDEVPAATPVLLYAEGGATEDIPVMTGAAAVSDNDLVAGTGATVATTDGDYTNMILNNGGSGIGFYFAAGQTVATNRAYLHIATSLAPAANSRMSLVFEDETTGIQKVESAESNAKTYYNLSGQRVAAPAKGLYIVNGKKVIIK